MSIDITSANATAVLNVAELGLAVGLQQFSADSSFTSDNVQIADVRMGVDGKLAAGQVNNVKQVTITLEANSPSTQFLTLLKQAMETNRKVYECNLIISIPSIGKVCTYAKGVLQSYKSIPDGNTVLGNTVWVFQFESLKEGIL